MDTKKTEIPNIREQLELTRERFHSAIEELGRAIMADDEINERFWYESAKRWAMLHRYWSKRLSEELKREAERCGGQL